MKLQRWRCWNLIIIFKTRLSRHATTFVFGYEKSSKIIVDWIMQKLRMMAAQFCAVVLNMSINGAPAFPLKLWLHFISINVDKTNIQRKIPFNVSFTNRETNPEVQIALTKHFFSWDFLLPSPFSIFQAVRTMILRIANIYTESLVNSFKA